LTETISLPGVRLALAYCRVLETLAGSPDHDRHAADWTAGQYARIREELDREMWVEGVRCWLVQALAEAAESPFTQVKRRILSGAWTVAESESAEGVGGLVDGPHDFRQDAAWRPGAG
jgi:hypothetical protein